jgi:hypothetical protein
MKKVVLAGLVLLIVFAVGAHAEQSNDDTVTISKSQLTPEQLTKLQQEELEKKVATYGKWVGIGREVGVAVNSSLEAITTQADHFAHTGVGKFTMVLVAWKVIGDQAVHLIVGLLEVLLMLPLWIWSYRRFCIPRSMVIKKGQGFWGAKEYEVVNKFDPENPAICIGHWVALLLIGTVVLFTVFSY